MPQRSLVTGGAGFIGSHLVYALHARGEQVRILDNLATGSCDNLCEIWADLDFREQDLRDSAACRSACEGVDTVYHLGALGSVPRSVEDPLTTNAVNVDGTLNLLDAARRAGVRRVVFSSSSSVYGDTPTLPKHEEMRPSPRSPYAVSKLTGEEYCRAFALTYGLETVVLRYFNVFGPRQSPHSAYAAVLPRFVTALLAGKRPVLYGDGEQSRDFTYVSNVVDANLLAAQADNVAGGVFNIACSDQITVRAMLEAVAGLLHCEADPVYEPARAGDVRHSRADITAARTRLNYCPGLSFVQGLERTLPWYVAHVTPIA
jgi:nucleoside-diphosphate-sugar epimerase